MKTNEAMQILQNIHRDINQGILVLPTLPDTANKIRLAMNNISGSSADLIADIINEDIATASRVVQVANSPIYASNDKVSSVKAAVIRLGNNTTYQLINSFLVQQLFQSGGALQNQTLKAIWSHSVNVAAMCRAFAMFAPHLNAEQAMLAGLTHQIGKLPILKYFSHLPSHDYDQAQLNFVLDKAHHTLGHLLLQTWNFPDALTDVPLEYGHLDRKHDKPADYVDLVQVAYLQAVVGSNDSAASRDWSTVNAFAKLGFTPSDELINEESMASQIDWARSILNE